MLTVQAGATVTVVESFTDDFGVPLVPQTPPTVVVLDAENYQVYATTAMVGALPGQWSADLAIPRMDNKAAVPLTAVWGFIDGDGTRYRARQQLVVEPAQDIRPSECVALYGDRYFSVTVPYLASASDLSDPRCTYTLYEDNDEVFSFAADQNALVYRQNLTSTEIQFPLALSKPKVKPRLLLARRAVAGKLAPDLLTFHLWYITPAVLNATTLLENYVNKSRIANVIPELQYATSDLLQALKSGLDTYNSLAPYLTAFDGTNMQGVLLESWLLCSTYELLNMQYMAEGSLAFDFSGQTVNLNVDRTQYIESMMGRIQEEVENTVKPAKKLVVKSGAVGGDGSAGGRLGNLGKNFGLTTLINAPTTRLRTTSSTFRRYW